jgi:hypothetical protein
MPDVPPYSWKPAFFFYQASCPPRADQLPDLDVQLVHLLLVGRRRRRQLRVTALEEARQALERLRLPVGDHRRMHSMDATGLAERLRLLQRLLGHLRLERRRVLLLLHLPGRASDRLPDCLGFGVHTYVPGLHLNSQVCRKGG